MNNTVVVFALLFLNSLIKCIFLLVCVWVLIKQLRLLDYNFNFIFFHFNVVVVNVVVIFRSHDNSFLLTKKIREKSKYYSHLFIYVLPNILLSSSRYF